VCLIFLTLLLFSIIISVVWCVNLNKVGLVVTLLPYFMTTHIHIVKDWINRNIMYIQVYTFIHIYTRRS